MPFAAFLLTTALPVAPLVDARDAARGGDYPSDMLQAGKSALGNVELIISPKGKVESCTLLSSVGDEKFAGRICPKFAKARWHPALGSDGSPIYGEFRTSLKFFVPGTRQGQEVEGTTLPADFETGFPESVSNGGRDLDVDLAVEVGADGRATACSKQPFPASKNVKQELVDHACSAMMQRTFKPIDTAAGPIQHYVTRLTVRFRDPKKVGTAS